MSYPALMFLQEVEGVRSSNGRVHRRLFEKTAMTHNGEILNNLRASLRANLIKSPDKIFKDFGEDVKAKITEGFGDPSFLTPNSPNTQSAKGGRNTPLVDTGDLKANLKYRVRKKS